MDAGQHQGVGHIGNRHHAFPAAMASRTSPYRRQSVQYTCQGRPFACTQQLHLRRLDHIITGRNAPGDAGKFNQSYCCCHGISPPLRRSKCRRLLVLLRRHERRSVCWPTAHRLQLPPPIGPSALCRPLYRPAAPVCRCAGKRVRKSGQDESPDSHQKHAAHHTGLNPVGAMSRSVGTRRRFRESLASGCWFLGT